MEGRHERRDRRKEGRMEGGVDGNKEGRREKRVVEKKSPGQRAPGRAVSAPAVCCCPNGPRAVASPLLAGVWSAVPSPYPCSCCYS